MFYKSIMAAALVAVGLSSAAYAAANTSDTAETKAFALATISAADAAKAVEVNSGGKVVELTLRDENGKPSYQVSVMQADGSEATFLVDAMSGSVTASTDAQDSAAAQDDATENGESVNDADASSEDAD